MQTIAERAAPRPCSSALSAALAAVLLLAPSSLAAQAERVEAPTLERALARLRTSLGTAERAGLGLGVCLVGNGLARAVEGEAERLVLLDGRYRRSMDGPLPAAECFDGEDVSTSDWNRTPYRLHLADREAALLVAWLQDGYWLVEGAPLRIRLAAPGEGDGEPSEGELRLVLALADGTLEGVVAVDTEAWLPTSLTLPLADPPQVTGLADWREVRGVRFPFRVVTQSSAESSRSVAYERAEVVEDAAVARIAGFRAPPEGTRFLADVPPDLPLRRAPTGHMLVKALVDGEDRGWFIVDTGAGTLCISPEIADACGMPSFGSVEARGVAGSTTTAFRKAKSLTIGPLVLEEPVFIGLDLAFLEPHFGVPVAGICGFEAFSRGVFEIDLASDRLRVHDPARYALPELVEGAAPRWGALTFEGRIPCLAARYEGGRAGNFRFDSGSSGALELDADTVAEHDLLAGRELGRANVGGVGGFRRVDTGTLAWLELAGRRFEDFQATFSRPGPSAKLSSATDGVLGLGLFSDCVLVFDYARERFAVLPPR